MLLSESGVSLPLSNYSTKGILFYEQEYFFRHNNLRDVCGQ